MLPIVPGEGHLHPIARRGQVGRRIRLWDRALRSMSNSCWMDARVNEGIGFFDVSDNSEKRRFTYHYVSHRRHHRSRPDPQDHRLPRSPRSGTSSAGMSKRSAASATSPDMTTTAPPPPLMRNPVHTEADRPPPWVTTPSIVKISTLRHAQDRQGIGPGLRRGHKPGLRVMRWAITSPISSGSPLPPPEPESR
jgi:hypothetical protein